MRSRILTMAMVFAGFLAVLAAVLGLSRAATSASAAAATGVVVGQVVWNSPMPVPYGAPTQPGMAPAPDLAPEVAPNLDPPMPPAAEPEAAPGAMPEAPTWAFPRPMPPIPIRPPQPRLIPAGAVVVAVQGTAVAARTDESGRFRLEGVPVGQYLTVAAGPVRGVSTAFVIRPNAFLRDAGQTVDLGRLYLGQPYGPQPLPYGASGAAEPEGEEAP